MKHIPFKKIFCLFLTIAISCSLVAIPATARTTQAGDVPCPTCNGYHLIEEIRQPTCTKSGGCFWICQSCGSRFLMAGTPYWNSLNQPALGHSYVGGVCTRCGETDPNYVPPTPDPDPGDNSDSSGSGESTTCSHNWTYKTIPPTCTQAGQQIRTCSLCGAQETQQGDPATGHQYQLTSTTPATTQQEGMNVYTCSLCGDSYEEIIDKLPSSPDPDSSENPDSSKEEQPACTQHKWSYKTTPASCTQEGEYGRTCTNCGVYEVIRSIAKTSHSWKYATTPATCTQEGQYTRTCSVCGTQEVVRTLPKSSHTWSYNTTAATCAQEGQYTRTCKICGTVEVLSTTPKLDHQYTSTIVRAATATQDGLRTYTCSRCGDCYNESIPKLGGSLESSIVKDPNAAATPSTNLGGNAYTFYHSNPMASYLYQRSDGGFTRVEAIDNRVVVEAYDKDFQLLTSSSLSMELPLFGGFYAGSGYNFLIFGQTNLEDSAAKEVIRVVKYSKDWERLGQVSLTGANTHIPFDAGSLRCTEYNGMLYVHTCHTMFASRDGLNHQANLIFSVRQSDMTITDSQYNVSAVYEGYVSHSFNQFVLVDQAGRLVTVNHGDAIPRGAILLQYDRPAGGDTFVNYNVKSVEAMSFVKSSKSYNYTGAQLGGLEASSSSYLLALSTVAQIDDVDRYKTYNVVLSVTGQDIPKSYSTQTGRSQLISLTNYSEGGSQSAGVPQLVKLSNDKFLVLWNIETKDEYGYYRNSGTIGYTFVDGKGNPLGQTYTAHASLSDCQPILAGNQVVWYTTDDSLPAFYSIDLSSGTLHSAGASPSSDGEQTETDPEQPEEKPDVPPQGNLFPDVNANYWGYSYIATALEKGLVAGCPDGTFQPDASVTGAQFCTMLTQGFYKSQLGNNSSPSDTWWKPFVQTANQAGLLQGTQMLTQYTSNGGQYGSQPDAPLTRYEMAQMMYNLILQKGLQLPDRETQAAAQASIRDWNSIPTQYQSAVSTCYALHLLSGNNNGMFDGSSNMTRAQACVVLSGLLNQLG